MPYAYKEVKKSITTIHTHNGFQYTAYSIANVSRLIKIYERNKVTESLTEIFFTFIVCSCCSGIVGHGVAPYIFGLKYGKKNARIIGTSSTTLLIGISFVVTLNHFSQYIEAS